LGSASRAARVELRLFPSSSASRGGDQHFIWPLYRRNNKLDSLQSAEIFGAGNDLVGVLKRFQNRSALNALDQL
jgi:hypothetical protein